MRPLSRNFRRTLFWALSLLFIVGAPLVIGYSVGYRLDDALSLVQTGGIFIHSDMSNTRVYLDGEFIENTGVILRSTLIRDLAPKRFYEVWVEKPGYQSWVKTLYVRPNLVTEARVLMLPGRFEWTILEATTTLALVDAVVLNGGATTSTSTEVANPEFVEQQEFFADDRGQFAVEVATSTYTYVLGRRTATTTTVTLIEFPEWLVPVASISQLASQEMVRERDGVVAWLNDGNVHATWARRDEQVPYYFCSATCTKQFIIDWEEPIMRYEFYPGRSDVVIVHTFRGVYAVELDGRTQRNIQPFLEDMIVDFRVRDNDTLVVFDGRTYRETSW